MIGVIAGDVIGSVYEHRPTKAVDFPLFHERSRFTDDTVMTVATARAILEGVPYDRVYRELGQRYPNAGYGGGFYAWLFEDDPQPYNSWGNGSAMRVAPVGFAFESVEDVLREAERSAAVTHDHPEGVKGAQATALAVFLARTGTPKEAIRQELIRRFGYDLERTVEGIRPTYRFDVSCQGPFRKRLSPSSTREASRRRSGWRSRSAVTRTRRRRSPAASPTHSTAACPRRSKAAFAGCSPWSSSR